MASAKPVTDHEIIRRWVEERKGHPATVRTRGMNSGVKSDVGMLRVDFPGGAGEVSLKAVSWNQWFKKFDEKKLAALLQEKTAGGKTSRFIKLVSRKH